MDKYQQVIADSHVTTDDAVVAAKVKEILDKHLEENRKPEVLKQMFNSIDLTTLKSTDSQRSVADFVERVNAFEHEHPDLPNVAAICVYPNFVPIVRTVLDVSEVDIAAVAGCFPSAQSFIEVKIAEIGLAVEAGADEIDVVFALGDFFDKDYEEVCDQLSEMKHSCRDRSEGDPRDRRPQDRREYPQRIHPLALLGSRLPQDLDRQGVSRRIA